MKIVAISDTHGLHRKLVLPPGDVLIHAGDITPKGETHVVVDFAKWLATQPFAHILVIAGNHDHCLDIARPSYDGLAVRVFEEHGIHYLCDSSRTLDGVKFYGAPWCPRLPGWAFFDREQDQFEHAPRDIDVLITHAPPHGIRDDASDESHFGSRHVVRYINRCPRLKLHIFGHVHGGYGQSSVGSVKFVNAASLADRVDNTLNAPMTIDYDEILRESGVSV